MVIFCNSSHYSCLKPCHSRTASVSLLLFLMHLLLQGLLSLPYPIFFQFSFQIILTLHLFPLFNSAIEGTCKVDNFAHFWYYLLLPYQVLPQFTWSVCILKSHNIFQESFSTTFSGSCLYHFSFTSKPIFLHTSQCIFLLTQSCLLLYSLCTNMGHSHTMSHCLIYCVSTFWQNETFS